MTQTECSLAEIREILLAQTCLLGVIAASVAPHQSHELKQNTREAIETAQRILEGL